VSTSPHLAPSPADDPRRLVAMTAVHNFRDLGGYPALDGQVTRWGCLYRADGLNRLQGDDIEVVRRLGLRTVVDLRSHAELDERGRFPVDHVEVRFAHLPVLDATWQVTDAPTYETDQEFLLWAYRQMLAIGSARFAAAVEELARPGALPAVFHCAAGKDRTGILAGLILGVLGVPREHLLADYALTAAAMVRMRAWADREVPDMVQRMADTPSAFLAAVPEALGELLDELEDEHGSIEGYLRSLGVASASFDALRRELLAPAAP